MHNYVTFIVDLFLHLDKNLAIIISNYGTLTYAFLFFVIFMETGFVVTPFLPGDSLIFAAGALSTTTSLNIFFIYIILALAAILGDSANYWIGHFIGPKIFEKDSKFIKKKYLIKTQKFYEKYGNQTIILARFVPIVRTFAPFVAGVAKMHYGQFFTYNIVGGLLWVALFSFSGYFFGNLPIVKENFHYVVVVIIFISILPMFYEIIKAKFGVKEE